MIIQYRYRGETYRLVRAANVFHSKMICAVLCVIVAIAVILCYKAVKLLLICRQNVYTKI